MEFISAVIRALTRSATSVSLGVAAVGRAPSAPPVFTARQLAVDCPTRVLVAVLRVTMFVLSVVRDDWAEFAFVFRVLTWD